MAKTFTVFGELGPVVVAAYQLIKLVPARVARFTRVVGCLEQKQAEGAEGVRVRRWGLAGRDVESVTEVKAVVPKEALREGDLF
jgi:hypothetical protein